MTIKPANTVSINVMIARGLAAAITVAGYLMIYPVFKLHEDMVASRQQQINAQASSMAYKITDALQNISRISRQIASTREVKDMALMGDAKEIEVWSVKTRGLFPSSVGMGLFSQEDGYIGALDTLRVGKQCAIDTALYLRGEQQDIFPVHASHPELQHFDVLNKVTDNEGNVSSVLLMSFHLSMLQDILDRYAEAGYSYDLKTTRGLSIVSLGDDKYPYVTLVDLPDSGWLLEVSADDSLSMENWRLIQFGVATLVIVALLLVLVAWLYVSRQLKADINRVKLLLSYRYLDDENKPSKGSDIQLSEIAELLSEIDQLADDVSESRTQLELEACTDALTGLLNRRGFEEDRAKLYRLASRQAITLVLLDVDSFKSINDTYGHAAGDKVLKVLGRQLRRSVRSTDKIYRLGGDEIMVVFSTDNMANLQQWYESVSEEFSDELTAMEEHAATGPGFTLSAGATRLNSEEDESVGDAMVRADKALYEAKDTGRARLIIV